MLRQLPGPVIDEGIRLQKFLDEAIPFIGIHIGYELFDLPKRWQFSRQVETGTPEIGRVVT